MRTRTGGVLEIGNHPPPICGWSIQTTLVKEELRKRRCPVSVLNIGENRKQLSDEYVDVQNGIDFLWKLLQFGLKRYRFHIHFNALSKKGFVLSYVAALVGAMFGPRPVLTFHGGLPQDYFPVERPHWLRFAFHSLFRMGFCVTCDSEEIRAEIVKYGIEDFRVKAIPCVSSELLMWKPLKLPKRVETFLTQHNPVFFSYVRMRPEYGFDVFLRAIRQCAETYPEVGFIWMGPSSREIPGFEHLITASGVNGDNLMLLPNADHDEFLTTMSRCDATIRVHGCDGVSASVLESLALGVPVIACKDGRRPAGVITYDLASAADLLDKILLVARNRSQIAAHTPKPCVENNTSKMVELLMAEQTRTFASQRSLHDAVSDPVVPSAYDQVRAHKNEA